MSILMVPDIIKSAFEFLKLTPQHLIGVASITALILFLPKPCLQRLGLFEFSNANRPWIGFIFLASSVLWLLDVLTYIPKWIRDWKNNRNIQNTIIKKLKSLNEYEKQILRYYFEKGSRANILQLDNGNVLELVACKVIYRSGIGTFQEGVAHKISDFAWNYINSNPHVLDGTTSICRTDKRDKF